MDSSVELVRHLLQSVVYIHTTVPRDHPSTKILGNERLGSGVVVDTSGLILTVNYVVMGGHAISVAFQKGRRAKAALVAPDFEICLGLTRANRRVMGRDSRLAGGDRRAWLGIFAYVIEEGVVVAGVVPDGPGDRGGLQEGDLIVSLNAEEVGSRRDLYMSLWRHEPGEALTLEVMRDNKVRRFEVKGGDRAHFFRQL